MMKLLKMGFLLASGIFVVYFSFTNNVLAATDSSQVIKPPLTPYSEHEKAYVLGQGLLWSSYFSNNFRLTFYFTPYAKCPSTYYARIYVFLSDSYQPNRNYHMASIYVRTFAPGNPNEYLDTTLWDDPNVPGRYYTRIVSAVLMDMGGSGVWYPQDIYWVAYCVPYDYGSINFTKG